MKVTQLVNELTNLQSKNFDLTGRISMALSDPNELKAKEVLIELRNLFNILVEMRPRFEQIPPIAKTEISYSDATRLYRELLEPLVGNFPKWRDEIKGLYIYF